MFELVQQFHAQALRVSNAPNLIQDRGQVPVPFQEPKAPETFRVRSYRKVSPGGRLKLTGKSAEAYRFTHLLGSRGRLNRFKGMIGT
jgi:hypothetical protein